ncbi:variant erythrocyte surface antigen-1 family protein, partial [Babesia divergens]
MSIIIIVILESQSALGLYFLVLFLVYSFHCLSFHCKVRMFFIPSCCPGCRIVVCLSVLRTLRSVLTGSSEPLGRIMVCYMYYTDVFVGSDNINNLKNALIAELGSFNSNDLTQLVQGLCLFMGYPSCVCSLKTNVDKSLQDISEKLLKDFKAVKSSHSIPKLDLNCSCKSDEILCKCCVIRCIKELRGKSKSKCSCPRLSNTSNSCQCPSKADGKCCKDFLSGLEACLSLLNLQTDMEDCKCVSPDCCETGTCTNKSCDLCNPKNFSEFAMTGLGICPMNPKKLAEKLEKFFRTNTGGSCDCQCGTSGSPIKSCCCLACPDNQTSKQNCLKSCDAKCGSQGCSSQHSQECPCKTFCLAINGIKIASNSTEMTCCEGGQKCHCQVEGTICSSSSSGQTCCETVNKSLKCLIRRLVKFFKDLSLDSPDKCSKLCCELLCVLKICQFLRTLYNDSKTSAGKDSCGTCSKGKGGNCPAGTKGNSCCGGKSACNSGDCCQGCSECNAIKLGKALQELQYSSPCGQDLWRTLDSFLNFIRNVFYPKVRGIQTTLQDKTNGHNSKCKCNSGTCTCSPSSCQGCAQVLEELQTHKDVLSLMTRGYSSAYSSSKAKWNLLCSHTSPCSGCSPSCPCQSSGFASLSPCYDGKCCENCDVKKAAKIFLGFLPCLFHALQYLYDKCKGGWNWKDLYISDDKPLHRFLVGMGYNLGKLDQSKKGGEIFELLKTLFNGSDGPLEKLYNVSKNYFTSRFTSLVPSSTSSDSKPETVRDILLWLSGLPFTSGFKALLEHCKRLCDSIKDSSNPVNFIDFESSLYASCLRSPFVLAAIQWPGKSEIFPLDFSNSLYPEDPSDLLEKLCEYTRKVFAPLKFLEYQCGKDRNSAGWQYCGFGKSCMDALKSSFPSAASTSTPSCCTSAPKGILCTTVIGVKNHSEHCTKGTCMGLQACSKDAHTQAKDYCDPCPHPLLMFLLDGSLGSDPGKSYSLFKLPEDSSVPRMGFKAEHLPEKARKGKDLLGILKDFCDSGDSPLTRLFKFLTCISRTPPENLGEFFSFFKVFVPKLTSTFESYASKEPGTPDGPALKKAIQGLYNSQGKHPKGNHSSPKSDPNSHSADLYSLSGCHAPKAFTCGPYLNLLTEDVYDIFVEDFLGTYLSWVCHVPRMFREKVEEFRKKFSDCCSKSSCKSIIYCPCAWPLISSQGFSFTSPSSLSGETNGKKARKCSDFIKQLEKVVSSESPLQDLLEEIEKFLWSIRLPFFLFVLAFWVFVISYFLYVQLYKLDLLHLK